MWILSALATHPLWAGLLADTTLYFAQSKDSLCLSCAYDLSGVETENRCPECGAEFLIEDVVRAWWAYRSHAWGHADRDDRPGDEG